MKYYNLKNFGISKNFVRKKLLKAFSVRRMWKYVKRSVALTLSFMMLVQPLHAYDTDLISIASGATSGGKPNVLLILDTSDSMNLGLAWDEVSDEDARTYNSHVEYLWNNLDYIARIGCYDKSQAGCITGAGVSVNDPKDFDNSPEPVNQNDPPASRNHAPLTYDDAYKYGSLPQGYFKDARLKKRAFDYANSIDSSSQTSRKRYEIRDYSGIDSLHGDRGQGQASPCKYTLAPKGVARSGGDSICATPIKSKYVWWTRNTVPASTTSGSSPANTPPLIDKFAPSTSSQADVAPIATDDSSLFSDSFNRFIGEDTVTPFSSLFAGDKINRGGMDFFTSRGVNYPGGYQLLANGNLPNQILDTVKLQLKSNQAQTNRCMSSYFGSGHASGVPSGLIPSTVNAPGPFEKNAGYMVTGWMRWQPFRYGVRDARLSPAAAGGVWWDMKLANYPGPFQITETGEVLGWRDNRWLPPRIQGTLPDGTLSDAGWEPLQADLGNFSDYYNAVLNVVSGFPSCSGAWSEYCDGTDNGKQTSPPTTSLLASDAPGQGRWAAKLPTVLGYYGIKSIPSDISASMDHGHGAPSGANYRVNDTGDLRWSFTALRGGGANVSGPAGNLPGISFYYDTANALTDTCQVTCKPTGTNPTSFATVNGINKTVYGYDSKVTCGVDTVPANCTPVTDAACAPSPTTVPVRQFTRCDWKNRNSEGVSGEAGRTRYFGGTCAATCVGDCEKFDSATPIGQVGNNNIGGGESPTTTVQTSLRCDYDQDGNGNPTDTYNTQGRCNNKEDFATPQEVNCPTWYDATGTPHPTCIFYDGSTPAATCKPVSSLPVGGGVSGLKYNFQFASSADSFVDCTADNGRNASELRLANQVDSFNPSIGTVVLNIDAAQKKSFGTGYGDVSYGVTKSTPGDIAVYSSNYLNYIFGPKGFNGKPIGRQTRLQVAKDALANIVSNSTDQYRFGLMAFNDPDPKDGGSQGARVIFPVSYLPGNSVTAKDDTAEFLKRLLWLEARSKTPLAPAMYEAYLYYAGGEPSSQYNKDAYNNKITTIPSTLSGIVDGKGNYLSPIDAALSSSLGSSAAQQAYCLKNIIILITDGGPQDDDGMNAQIKKLKGTAADGTTIVEAKTELIDSTTGLPFGPKDDKYRLPDGSYTTTTYSYLDEMTNFLNKVSVRQTSRADRAFNNVITYTIGFAGADSPVLVHAGDPDVSGGKYYDASDAVKLQTAIKESLGAAREYVPTLSTPVTPLSALSKSQDADEIYISSIKPSASMDIWPGNMKKYKLGSGETLCGTQVTKDANGKENTIPIDLCIIGQDPINGTIRNISPPMSNITDGSTPVAVISDQARSYWSDDKDGRIVLKGGIFDRLLKTNVDLQGKPDVSKRLVYTHISGMFGGTPPGKQGGGALSLFEASNTDVVNSAAFSRVSANERKQVINKIRGADVTMPECSDINNQGLCTAFADITRHESPLHSPGVVVTYQAAKLDGTGQVKQAPVQRLFYVTINGMLHAVDPIDETYGTSGNIGKEMWGFVPEEVLAQAADHPYLTTQNPTKAVDGPIALFDGQPNVWLKPCRAKISKSCNGDVEQAILYFGMRRGAGDWSATKRGVHSYYAVDVTHEDSPKLLWKITSVPDTTVAPDVNNPEPRIGYLCDAVGKCDVVDNYSELGQTWSTPMPVKLNQRKGTDFVEGLVFTGGYDARQDCVLPDKDMGRRVRVTTGRKNDRDCVGTDYFDTQGRAIYVVDASTGVPIATFMDDKVVTQRNQHSKMLGETINPPTVSGTPGTSTTGVGLRMSNSIAGAVGVYNVDLDAANTIDRLYVGDMGGVLWRVDMQNTEPKNWMVYPIASLSTIDGNNNVLNDRPIFFQPQVLLSNDNADLAGNNSGQDKYDYVYIPTSDFEHPTEIGMGVNNKLFMVKDWESRGSVVAKANSSSVQASDLKPAIMGEFNSGSYSNHGYKSEILNVTAFTVKPGENPQQKAADNQLKLAPGSQSWATLNGWYIDFDIDPTTGKQYTDYKKWVEVATGPALIYKDRNPASANYGSSILNFTTYRYGTVDTLNCTASGVGYTWAMEATTGAAIVTPPVLGGNGQGSIAAAPVTRIGNANNGGFTSGGGTTTGVAATPALKVIHCEIVKTAPTGASLASSVVGEACSATKAYWYNQLSN